ncbi:MOSC domain-containing protein [Salinisphaera sp. T31B1]|uniref:MOSC domain-containing protein n=1 Tax=Salinisphaera sp. T31B1 TaxID=727963 RepID=UPI00333F6214
MRPCDRATAVAGRGLHGDRYWAGVGTFSGRFEVRAGARELSLIDTAALTECNRRLAAAGHAGVAAAALRRNLLVDGLALSELVGQRLVAAGVQIEVLTGCPPCGYLSRLLGADMRRALYRIGGVRARIVRGGELRVGATVAAG